MNFTDQMNASVRAGILVAAFSGLAIGALAQADESQAQRRMTAQLEALRVEVGRQNEKAVPTFATRVRVPSQFNENKNLYFGDTHVHTALSFDSYLTGNRLSLRDAYRFANGEELTLITGETTQLSQALDFVVMSDHAEGFGTFEICRSEKKSARQADFCKSIKTPSKEVFMRVRKEGQQRPPIRSEDMCGEDLDGCLDAAKDTWRVIRNTAEEFNKPGVFTAFAGYEYSPLLPMQGKVHRNVIFKNSQTPNNAVSAFDADTVLDLWHALESDCKGECEFLTIPHNMNKTWGIAYSGKTIDGDSYTQSDWALRGRSEPIAEIFQAKGSSECGLGVGASDEECNFELNMPICQGEQVPGCSGRTSFAREGLKIGLELQPELGFNPLQFGFIGSTDTHNSTPGDTEEYDWRGTSTLQESPASKRLNLGSSNKTFSKPGASAVLRKNPGGLAAVWATENSRDAIFEGMQAREVYATSGTRIKLRFFAGWGYPAELIEDTEMVKKAYAAGVPMGGTLNRVDHQEGSPDFLIWATKDSAGADLQRVQMIKAWTENGKSQEEVIDIACSGDLKPNSKTGRCPDNGARVDINTCEVSNDKGNSEIKTLWRDPNFKPEQSAVYYVRILENPSCRWSSYDALRLGVAPPADTAATIQERAWSSPIWYET